MSNWTEKTVWTCEINNTTLEVTHHWPMTTEPDKWTITVFIYPDHPVFNAIDNDFFDLNSIPTVTFNHTTLHTNYDSSQDNVSSFDLSGYRVFNSDWNLTQQNREMFKDAKTLIKWLNATE